MKYHELETQPTQSRKRVGRGISAGQGKTAGRGTKGQNARTGKKLRAAFMGGQGPLVQRIPKLKGFKSLRVPAQVVYLDQLNNLTGVVDNAKMFQEGLVSTPYHSIKVIARGEYIGKGLTLKVQGASASVVAELTKAGGAFVKNPVPLKESSKPRNS